MSNQVMLVVLFAALLHATWNTLAKSGSDALIDTTLILIGGSVFAIVVLPFIPAPAPASWPFIAASSILQIAYFALVASAYRGGDMSLAYPLMRGTAPLVLVLLSVTLAGEPVSVGAACGIGLTCAGVLTMALARRRQAPERRTIAFALANAVVIASYTLIDGLGARRSGQPFAYTMIIFVAACALFVPWVAWRHPTRLAAVLRRRWHLGLAGGGCIVMSYGLALWAMTRAPIAPVAALRESSILFALVLARVVLREQPSPVRLAGGLLILAGAGTLRFG